MQLSKLVPSGLSLCMLRLQKRTLGKFEQHFTRYNFGSADTFHANRRVIDICCCQIIGQIEHPLAALSGLVDSNDTASLQRTGNAIVSALLRITIELEWNFETCYLQMAAKLFPFGSM